MTKLEHFLILGVRFLGLLYSGYFILDGSPVGRSSKGQRVTSPLGSLLCDLWEWAPSAPLDPRALCPGSHKNARVCQVCGWYLPSRHLHAWMETDWESSGSLWVHQAEIFRWVTDSNWNLMNSDGGIWGWWGEEFFNESSSWLSD